MKRKIIWFPTMLPCAVLAWSLQASVAAAGSHVPNRERRRKLNISYNSSAKTGTIPDAGDNCS